MSTPNPSATLAALPAELKARIVALAAEQDAALRLQGANNELRNSETFSKILQAISLVKVEFNQ